MKSLLKRITVVLLLLAMIVPMAKVPAEAATAKLNKKKLTLTVGETYRLKLKNTTKKVTWTSSDKKVATVSSKGTVTAKSAGTVKITAKCNKKKYTCTVTVNPAKVDTANAFLGNIWGNVKNLSDFACGYTAWGGKQNLALGDEVAVHTENCWETFLKILSDEGILEQLGKLEDKDFTFNRKTYAFWAGGPMVNDDTYTYESDGLKVEILYNYYSSKTLAEAFNKSTDYSIWITISKYNDNALSFEIRK